MYDEAVQGTKTGCRWDGLWPGSGKTLRRPVRAQGRRPLRPAASVLAVAGPRRSGMRARDRTRRALRIHRSDGLARSRASALARAMFQPSPSPVVHLELHTGNLVRACSFSSRVCSRRLEQVEVGGHSYQTLDRGGGLDDPRWIRFAVAVNAIDPSPHAGRPRAAARLSWQLLRLALPRQRAPAFAASRISGRVDLATTTLSGGASPTGGRGDSTTEGPHTPNGA